MRSTGNPSADSVFWDAIAALKEQVAQLKTQVLDDASNLTSPAETRQVTSVGYSEVFTVAAGTASSISIMFSADADAALTTGDVRAVDLATGLVVYGPVGVTLGTGKLFWDMPDLPLSADPWRLIEIQARLTSGTGTLTFRPYGSQGG